MDVSHFLSLFDHSVLTTLAEATAGGWTETLTPYLEHSLYFGIIIILMLCGLGLPVPEELTFLLAGYVASPARMNANVWLLCLCGLIGIMLGDSIPYWLGRRYGMNLLFHPWVARLIKPKQIEWTQEFFRKRGSKAVFVGRFFAGLRMPTFFLSGAMGVKYWTFFFWDFLGALISCPTSIWLAYEFGPVAEKWLYQSKVYVAIALGGLILYGLYQYYAHKEKPEPSVSCPPPAAPTASEPVAAPKEVNADVPK